MKIKAALLNIVVCLILFVAQRSEAMVWNVSVGNNFFNPSSISSAEIGDTIRWTLSSGIHTTTSTSVPAGANSWNYSFSGGGDSFDYKVLVAGTYNYFCTVHGASMSGSITVDGSASLSEQELSKENSIFPNPSNGIIQIPSEIEADQVKVYCTDGTLMGVHELDIKLEDVLDLTNCGKGNYLCVFLLDERVVLTERLVIIP